MAETALVAAEQPTTVAEIATAVGVAKKNVAKRLRGVRFTTKPHAGNAIRLYAIADLPQDMQVAVGLNRHLEQSQAAKDAAKGTDTAAQPSAPSSSCLSAAFQYDRDALWQRFEQISTARRERAEHKLKLIHKACDLMQAGVEQRRAFELVGAETGTPWRTIEDWYQGNKKRPGCKKYLRADWLAALADTHVGRTPTAECHPAAWDWFLTNYLRLEKPGLQAVYRQLQRIAAEHGWRVPDDHTLLRRLKREVPKLSRVLQREGELAAQRMYPHWERSVRSLSAMEWINGDGYQHNVFVLWPDGSVERPRTWFWQDVKSRKILAWRVDQTENTDLIRASFADVLSYGIPQHVTIDNTRAAANKWMTGGVRHRYRFKVKDDDPLGIFPMLGCKVHWTSVINGRGHGQAKPIERAFGVGGLGEVIDKDIRLAGAYTGANVTAKPENYGSKAVPLDQFIKVLATEIPAWNARLGRRTEMGEGKYSFDQVFERSYNETQITKATEDQRRLCLLCAEAVRVQRDTTFSLQAGAIVGAGRDGRNRYGSPLLDEFIGEGIVVRFDPQELHSHVYAYTRQGAYIGRAECIEAVGFGDTEAARELQRARKQFIRAGKAQVKAEMRMTAIAAGDLIPDAPATAALESAVVRMFRPPVAAPKEPVPLTEDQQAIHEQLLEEFAAEADVLEITNDPRFIYRRYLSVAAAIEAGRDLSEGDAQFYRLYHESTECLSMRKFFASFEEFTEQPGEAFQ